MTFEIVPAYEVSFSEQAEIFNRAFKGYLAGWHEMDAETVARFISAQGIDLCYSRFARNNGGQLASFGFINRTGNIARLAGMGTVLEARRTGAADFILSRLLDEAKQRADRAMVLEVFEQNTPAVPLYRRHGFREVMRLFGWRRPGSKTEKTSANDLEEIPLLAAAEMPAGAEFPDIPWQISRHIVPKLNGARAYKLENGCVVIGNPDTAPTRIHAAFGDESAIKRVLSGILAAFPENEFFVPAVFPEPFGETLLRPHGFVREPLNQFLMRRGL